MRSPGLDGQAGYGEAAVGQALERTLNQSEFDDVLLGFVQRLLPVGFHKEYRWLACEYA